MSKLRALLVGATAAGALAVGSFAPALAESVPVDGVGTLTVNIDPAGSGEITADGTVAGTPLDGYVTAYGDANAQDGDICADDNGAPGESESATCVSDLAAG